MSVEHNIIPLRHFPQLNLDKEIRAVTSKRLRNLICEMSRRKSSLFINLPQEFKVSFTVLEVIEINRKKILVRLNRLAKKPVLRPLIVRHRSFCCEVGEVIEKPSIGIHKTFDNFQNVLDYPDLFPEQYKLARHLLEDEKNSNFKIWREKYEKLFDLYREEVLKVATLRTSIREELTEQYGDKFHSLIPEINFGLGHLPIPPMKGL